MGRVDVNRGQAAVAIRNVSRDQFEQVGRHLLRLCQEECPVITGRLLSSHRIERISDEELHIVATAPYSLYVFDGDGPGRGRRPNRWMLRAIDRARI